MNPMTPQYQMSLRVLIQDTAAGGGHLVVEEGFRVDAQNFIEICKILGRFHELAEKLKQEIGK